MTDTEKAEYENVVRMLTTKLQETVDENDRLRAELARLTEGANAHTVLQSLYRNVDLPESLRAKCAIGALNVETPRLEPQPAPLDLVAEDINEPLPVVVERQRARADAMQREARNIEVSPSGAVRILPKPGSNGGNGSVDDGSSSN
jgi:hypothetical protein